MTDIQIANGGAMAFTTTHWSLVLQAQGESPAAQQALEMLCRTYWRPLYGFACRQGSSRDAAEGAGWANPKSECPTRRLQTFPANRAE